MKQQDTDADRGGPQRDSSDVREHSIMTIFTCTCICAYTHTRKDINTPTQIRMHAFTEDLQLLMEKEGQAELRLADNKIGAQAAERLAGVLGQCSSLAELDLRDNRIGVDGAERLAGVLGQCSLLVELHLLGNGIGVAVSYTHLTLPTILRV